jgi:hypothetical protein
MSGSVCPIATGACNPSQIFGGSQEIFHTPVDKFSAKRLNSVNCYRQPESENRCIGRGMTPSAHRP